MLVLSRKVDEEIVIGDGIVVKVVSIRGQNVRLGILAPPKTPIDRREVREEKAKAAAALPAAELPA